MENILKNFKFGTFLSILYKIFWFYKSDNTENFLKANIPKLALCDPNDNLVVEYSSLKSSLRFYICVLLIIRITTKTLSEIVSKDYQLTMKIC